MVNINKHKFFLFQILKEIFEDKGMLNGLGELTDDEMKKFVRAKLRSETITMLRFYRQFPILG